MLMRASRARRSTGEKEGGAYSPQGESRSSSVPHALAARPRQRSSASVTQGCMTFSHPSISFVTPRAGKLARKTILNRFHSLIAPRRIEIFITTTYAQLRKGVAVEVIHGLAVPGAVGGGDRDEQAGSDAVGAGHQRWSGVNRFLVRTSGEEGGGEKEEEKERGLCAKTQKVSTPAHARLREIMRRAKITPQSLND